MGCFVGCRSGKAGKKIGMWYSSPVEASIALGRNEREPCLYVPVPRLSISKTLV